jgi:hypothetical protein
VDGVEEADVGKRREVMGCLGWVVALAVGAMPIAAQSGPMASPAVAGGPDLFPTVAVTRTASPPSIDGVLDESLWSRAVPIPFRYEIWPGDNRPSPATGDCRIAFDDEALYVGCRALDPDPEQIRAYLTDRDDISEHDMVGIIIDPFSDARRGYHFWVNPLGVQRDVMWNETRGMGDPSWNAIWESAGRITQEGFDVEMALPFRSLRFPETSGPQDWQFFVTRHWPRSRDVWIRSVPEDKGDSCMLCQTQTLVGLADVAPGRNMEITPTLTGRKADLRVDGPRSDMAVGDVEMDAGLDARMAVTSEVNLNLTLNPDFSQVEADAAQLAANERFTLGFDERRPFFLEGAELFQTPVRAVFTRTIADPVAGAKVTGKVGSLSGGILAARDQVTGLVIPGNQGSTATTLDQGNTAIVARGRTDLSDAASVGALYTGRFGTGYDNQVAGIDGFWRPASAMQLRTQVLGSGTRYPGLIQETYQQDPQLFGALFRAEGSYRTRLWDGRAEVELVHPDFRADAGFVTRADARKAEGWVRRNLWAPEGTRWFTRFDALAGVMLIQDWGGALRWREYFGRVHYEGPLQSRLTINPRLDREVYQGRAIDYAQLWVFGNITPSSALTLGFVGAFGETLDVVNVQKVDRVRVGPRARLRPGRNVDLEVKGTWERLSKEGTEVLQASVIEGRGVYNFSTRAFVRAVVQYRRTSRNPVANPAGTTSVGEGLLTQFMFAYKVNAQTALHIGYGDQRLGGEDLDRVRHDLVQTSRTFFLKMGYAFRP